MSEPQFVANTSPAINAGASSCMAGMVVIWGAHRLGLLARRNSSIADVQPAPTSAGQPAPRASADTMAATSSAAVAAVSAQRPRLRRYIDRPIRAMLPKNRTR
jgi:hypothetical protein